MHQKKKTTPNNYPPIPPKNTLDTSRCIFKTQPQHCLNSVNYVCWKNLVRTALEKVEAYDIATGMETYPQTRGSASAIQAKQRDYRKRAATGLEVIQAACTPAVTTHINHLGDLREVWEALRLRFHTKDSDEARMMIRISFDRCTLKDDEKVMDYFNRLSKIRQQLSGSPAEINDFTFPYHTFRTFRQVPKFQMTVGFLQNDMRAGGLISDAAMNRIETAEQMHDEDTNIGDTSTTAEGLYASGPRRGRGSSRGRGRGRGRGHGGWGRGQGRGRGGSSNGKENDDRTCYHCGLKDTSKSTASFGFVVRKHWHSEENEMKEETVRIQRGRNRKLIRQLRRSATWMPMIPSDYPTTSQ